ncbi:MAG: prolyl oligopeptidase family serine peptidase [Acidimicrobiia bacterium]
MSVVTSDSFPQQYARTQRLTLGEPRNVTVSDDGRKVVFLRSNAGDDPVNRLWLFDVESGNETLVADPHAMLGADDAEDLPPEERARRERLREGAGGITGYSTDTDTARFVCTLSGRLFVGDLHRANVREIRAIGPVFDPRLSPDGRWVAYVSGRALRVVSVESSDEHGFELAGPTLFDEPDTVSWGSAEFVAAEEMDRYRGFWWSPNSRHAAVCRVDEAPVAVWHIADPAHPERAANAVRYPAAGTADAVVSLHVFDAVEGTRVDVSWDAITMPYLVDVDWIDAEALMLTVCSRDQRTMVTLRANRVDGATTEIARRTSDTWVDVVPGVPTFTGGGSLVLVDDRDGWKRLVVDGRAVTPTGTNVRAVINVGHDDVVFLANTSDHPECQSAHRWTSAGIVDLTPLDGINSVALGGATIVTRRSSVNQSRATTTVISGPHRHEIVSHAEQPLVTPRPRFVRAGSRRIPCALLMPTGHVPGTKVPVLMDPYGGPHAQRVVDSYAAHCTSQWFADQGFAVLVVDGRGTPGLGTEWERAVHLDLAGPVLEDQVDALHAVAAENPDLDLSRVGIRGWSFGGYLAALAVLRRPDVFHCAVAGAPVTEWRLYDTFYTERYLGHPVTDPTPYDRTSLLKDAPALERPLLLVHGLADDNVVAAHTLQFSSALLTAGKPHEVLPLSGVTHMTPQAVVAENLLLHQLDFLRRSLPLA